jgi:hypothetical protein
MFHLLRCEIQVTRVCKVFFSPPPLSLWRFDPIPCYGLHLRGFKITLIWNATLSRTPLEEWSARHRDLYLTTYKTDIVGTIHASVASSSARKSVQQLASENEVSPSTAWRIFRTDLRMHPYKIHVFQSLTTVCREKRTRFAMEFGDHLQQRIKSFCLMVEASDHGYVLHTRRIHVTRYRICIQHQWRLAHSKCIRE